MQFIRAGQGIVNDPVTGNPIYTEQVEQVDFGLIGEYIDRTGEGYALRLLLAAPDLLAAAEKAADIIACIPPPYTDQIAVPRACCLADLRRAIAKATT